MSILNQSNTDKFQTVFSNLPVPSTRNDQPDLRIINNYVRMITLPDYNIEIIPSDLMQSSIKNPISRFNNDISPITIDFTVDEDFDNYQTIFEWMVELRLGNPLKGETTLRESTIKSLQIIFKDNQDRTGPKMILKDLFPINLSSINLAFGNSEQSIFTVTFNYSTIDIERGTLVRNN